VHAPSVTVCINELKRKRKQQVDGTQEVLDEDRKSEIREPQDTENTAKPFHASKILRSDPQLKHDTFLYDKVSAVRLSGSFNADVVFSVQVIVDAECEFHLSALKDNPLTYIRYSRWVHSACHQGSSIIMSPPVLAIESALV
jgi:hypothetical protein